MTDIQVGDEVELTRRGLVVRVDKDSVTFESEPGGFYITALLNQVKLTKKAPPKVGDVITSVDQLDELPAGSVVVSIQKYGMAIQKASSGVWLCASTFGGEASPGAVQYWPNPTVVYIPEQ